MRSAASSASSRWPTDRQPVTRRAIATVLGAACAALPAGCGGSGKPRPDLVFVSSRSGVYALYAMNADGSRQKRISHLPHDTSATRSGLFFQTDPAWSQNGRTIAFASSRTGVSQIFVMNADGSGVRRLTHSKTDADQPAWSPNGGRVAYEAGDPPILYVTRADGEGKARLLGGGGASQAFPAWSPDGTRIAYVRREQGGSVTELWVMSQNGTGAHRLTKLGARVSSPAWSPDGKQIAFAANPGGGYAIYVVNLTSGRIAKRTNGDSEDLEPVWSPDGRLIAFSRDGSIATVDASGRVTTLTNAKNNDSSPVWNPVPAPPG